MARPKKNIEEAIEDSFFDLPIDRQIACLRMLEKLHRLKKRQRDDGPEDPQPEQVKLCE